MTLGFHGVCLDALNPTSRPSPRELAMMGIDAVRLVAFPDVAFFDYATSLLVQEIKVVVVLARESFMDGVNYYSEARQYARRIAPTLWVAGNEQDAGMLGVDSPSSWVMTPEVYGKFFGDVARGIKTERSHSRIIMGGLVAGQPAALPLYRRAVEAEYPAGVDGYDVHPYGKGVVEARDLLVSYVRVANDLTPYVLEWNRPAEEIPEFSRMLGAWTRGDCWFCWSDGQVEGMGLFNSTGWPHPEGRALSRAL